MIEVQCKIRDYGEKLQFVGKITKIAIQNEHPTVGIAFEKVQINQYRQLVEMLFCRPGQSSKTPGEFQSLLLLFTILLKPRVFFDKNRDVNAIVVSQI